MISSALSSGRHGCLLVNRLSDAFTAMENHGLDEVLRPLLEFPPSIRSPSICPATLSDFFSSPAPNCVLSYLLPSGIKWLFQIPTRRNQRTPQELYFSFPHRRPSPHAPTDYTLSLNRGLKSERCFSNCFWNFKTLDSKTKKSQNKSAFKSLLFF